MLSQTEIKVRNRIEQIADRCQFNDLINRGARKSLNDGQISSL